MPKQTVISPRPLHFAINSRDINADLLNASLLDMEAAILKRIKANENGPLRAQRTDGKTMADNRRRITVSQLNVATNKCFEYVDILSVSSDGEAFPPAYWRTSYPIMLLPGPDSFLSPSRENCIVLTSRTYFSIVVGLFSRFNRINLEIRLFSKPSLLYVYMIKIM